MKKVLLARPNIMIIDHVKKLIAAAESEPMMISEFEDIFELPKSEVGLIVISTTVSSFIKKEYTEVLEACMKTFPNARIFLATLSNIDSIKKIISKVLVDLDSSRLQSLDEEIANPKDNSIVLFHKSDLTDEQRFGQVLSIFQRKLSGDQRLSSNPNIKRAAHLD